MVESFKKLTNSFITLCVTSSIPRLFHMCLTNRSRQVSGVQICCDICNILSILHTSLITLCQTGYKKKEDETKPNGKAHTKTHTSLLFPVQSFGVQTKNTGCTHYNFIIPFNYFCFWCIYSKLTTAFCWLLHSHYNINYKVIKT